MGACTFFTVFGGRDAGNAFTEARREAQYERGHGGYTGTIAEKHDFVMISCPEDLSPATYANRLINDDDPRVEDKWGPAGCIQVEPGRWLFFGWASS